ncbi:MAG: hypothetical protein ABEJ31_02625 [Haloarculaceae archaeon]
MNADRVMYVGTAPPAELPGDPDGDWEVVRVETVDAAAARLGAVDCVVSEQALSDGSGLELRQIAAERAPAVPFVLVPEAPDD